MKRLRPYFIICLSGLLAFAPVSFMVRALKNDIIALEYPINHFISQSIRHGEIPAWFNTWGMGFPLESNLTWGIFSTPQMVFCSLFNYNIYALHIEFMFFILLAGWSMFYLLKRFFKTDETIAVLLSIAWMLSGFMVGSTQWMLYITAAAFIPLFIISLLSLLEKPSWRRSLQSAVCFTMMFTSVYAAFNIITVYATAVFLLLYFLKKQPDRKLLLKRLQFLLIAGVLVFLFCLPCLYLTFKLLNNISRGEGISGTTFFDSNYLHPGALSSMLFPFSSVRMQYANTEGTMLDSYAGLLILATLPLGIFTAIREKNKRSWVFLIASILFLIIAFGSFTPVRNALNILPGFSYFRNPALFRLYFLMMLIFFLASAFRNLRFENLMSDKRTRITLSIFFGVSLLVIGWKFQSINSIPKNNLTDFVKGLRYDGALLIGAAVQAIITGCLLVLTYLKKINLAKWVLTGDLALNTLLCTPFFSVSSYTLPEVNNILKSVDGFPIQKNEYPSEVLSTLIDNKGNEWYNINVFRKEISSRDSYKGPLVLKNNITEDSSLKTKYWVFIQQDSAFISLQYMLQRPSHVQVKANLKFPAVVTLQQNHYPGWKVYVNGEKQPVILCYTKIGEKGIATDKGISVLAPAGLSTIDFKYEHSYIWIWALIVHLIIISYCLWKLFRVFVSTRKNHPSASSG